MLSYLSLVFRASMLLPRNTTGVRPRQSAAKDAGNSLVISSREIISRVHQNTHSYSTDPVLSAVHNGISRRCGDGTMTRWCFMTMQIIFLCLSCNCFYSSSIMPCFQPSPLQVLSLSRNVFHLRTCRTHDREYEMLRWICICSKWSMNF